MSVLYVIIMVFLQKGSFSRLMVNDAKSFVEGVRRKCRGEASLGLDNLSPGTVSATTDYVRSV